MRNNNNLRRAAILLAGTAFATLAAAVPASAQAAEDPSVVSLEDIVVTARRTAESAQTVPVSVTAISGEALVKQGINGTNDLQRLIPGVVLNGAGSNSNTTYTIRGQTKSVTGAGLPSVITYLNEVPLTSIGSTTPTFDLENIQVLKGPQGTLFGRNTTGGAVLVYTAKPTYELTGYAQLDIGNYEKRYGQGAINVPIIDDKLAIRLAVNIERRHGYAKNFGIGGDQDDAHSHAFRASVLFEPFEGVKNIFVADYSAYETNGTAFYPVGFPAAGADPALVAAVRAQEALGKRAVSTAFEPFERLRYWGISNTTTFEFGSVTLKNIFGYRNTETSYRSNADGLMTAPLPGFLSSLGVVAGEPGYLLKSRIYSLQDQFTDELQLSGTALQDKLSWIFGGFYLKGRPIGKNGGDFDIFRPAAPNATTLAIVNGFLGGIWPISSTTNTLYGEESKAIYGNVSYALDGLSESLTGLKINIGARQTWDESTLCSNGYAGTLLVGDGLTTIPQFKDGAACRRAAGTFEGKAKSDALTYTIGLDYAVTDDVFFYFTTRKGYRAGGLNSPALATVLADFQTFAPQKITDYEVGAHVKWRAGDVRGRLNVAAFTGKFTDIQLQATGITPANFPGIDASNAPTGTALTINAGSSTARGVEVDGLIVPFEGFSLNYAVSYLDQYYNKLSVAPLLAPFFTSSNFSGSPKWSYQASASYVLPLDPAIGEVSLNASHYYLGKLFQGQAVVAAYHLTNARIDWSKIAGSGFSGTLYMDNVFDKRYVTNVLLSTSSFGLFTGSYGAPRTYGVRLRYDF